MVDADAARLALAFALALVAACQSVDCAVGVGEDPQKTPSTSGVATPAQPGNLTQQPSPTFPIRANGTSFVDASGRPFEWRGITAFRLAEMIANGREKDAIAYLDWAKSEELTVVRVLLMAHHLFKLSPEAGRAALPRLLEHAKARRIAVEVVALADTKDERWTTRRTSVTSAASRSNGETRSSKSQTNPATPPRIPSCTIRHLLQGLAALLPDPLVVALARSSTGEGYGAGDYVTTHTSARRERLGPCPRGQGWRTTVSQFESRSSATSRSVPDRTTIQGAVTSSLPGSRRLRP